MYVFKCMNEDENTVDYEPYFYEQNEKILKELKWQSQVLQDIGLESRRTAASAQNLWKLSYIALLLGAFIFLVAGCTALLFVPGTVIGFVLWLAFWGLLRYIFRPTDSKRKAKKSAAQE